MSDWGIEDLDLDAYLRRIGVTEPTLESLHAGHVRSIPFESLDVLRGNMPALDIASLQEKLVRRRRGGYCFEHNLLYAAVLERLGITVSRLLGRPMLGGPQAAPRTHMIVVAHQDDQPYLTDVGWGGGCLLEPMPLREGTMQQGKWTFRLSRQDENWVLASLISGEWRDLYGFPTDRQHPADFAMANFYTARWPESPFANRVIAQTSGPETRQTLSGNELAVISPQDGYIEKRTLTKDEVLEVLATRFGIDLSDTERDEVAARM